ncbi:uncharacterized protein LOC144434690 [Glandiceps talaboti]
MAKSPYTIFVAILCFLTVTDSAKKECPPGIGQVQCLVDPCTYESCPAYPEATCKTNYCGGCFAEFYEVGGRRLREKQCQLCPDRTVPVLCSVDPCVINTCPAYPEAKCVADYCGGCIAEFFDGKKQIPKGKCQAQG